MTTITATKITAAAAATAIQWQSLGPTYRNLNASICGTSGGHGATNHGVSRHCVGRVPQTYECGMFTFDRFEWHLNLSFIPQWLDSRSSGGKYIKIKKFK